MRHTPDTTTTSQNKTKSHVVSHAHDSKCYIENTVPNIRNEICTYKFYLIQKI